MTGVSTTVDDRPPSPTTTTSWWWVPRRHAWLLLAIGAVGLVRGLFWVTTTEILNPIDEAQHLGYVVSIAEGDGPPVVGRDLLQPEVVLLLKEPQTAWWRAVPRSLDPADPAWGAVTQQYEGVQPPAYYTLMAPVWWLASKAGLLTGVYALRLASLLLSLLAIPLTYLLARELFPRHPGAWLASPAVLVLAYGFNANLTSVTNDALVVPVGAALLLSGVRSLRAGFTWRAGAVTGALAGLALLTKPTMLGLVPTVGVLLAIALLARWTDLRAAVRWTAAAGVAAVAVFGPWLLWSLRTYGAPSPRHEVDLITGPLQPDLPLSLGALEHHLSTATQGFWAFQVLVPPYSTYEVTLHVAALVLGVGAAVTIWRRRRSLVDATLPLWAAGALLLVLAVMLVIIFGLFDGRSGVVGRHLYGALPVSAVALGGGAVVAFGRRAGAAVLAVLAAVALSLEPTLSRGYLAAVYLPDVLPGGAIPVAEQTWADGWVVGRDVTIEPPCETTTVAIVLEDPEAPRQLPFVDGPGRARLRAVVSYVGPRHFARYDVPATSDRFVLDLPDDLTIAASGIDRSPAFGFADHPGDPVAQVFCAVDEPQATRFDQRFDPQHPAFLDHGHVWAWFDAWRGIGVLAAALTVVWASRETWRDRQERERAERAERA